MAGHPQRNVPTFDVTTAEYSAADAALISGSLFGLLQNNVLNRHTWTTRRQLRIAIVTWIERTYHRRRRSLSRLTPIEFETIMTPPARQAA